MPPNFYVFKESGKLDDFICFDDPDKLEYRDILQIWLKERSKMKVICTMESVTFEDLGLKPDGDFLLIIDPRDQKLKQLYINYREIWLKGFGAAEKLEDMIDRSQNFENIRKEGETK